VIGYEESSHLDVEPAKYFVLVTKREKRACRLCEELGVVSAPLPPRIIEKCLASDRIVIDTVVSKYCNHTPLHRQSVILERDIGLEISRATLDGWVLKVGELLIPLVACMRRELISGSYIQADETPVDVQHARAEVRTAKRISGNTVAPEEARCSISPRPGCNSDCGADGRVVFCRRWRSPQSADYCGAPCPASGNSETSSR
jgi:transposase